MPRRYASKDIECPFYCTESQSEKRIYCEGITKATTTQIGFRGLERMKRHKELYCNGRYKECPIAIMLYRKYGE